MEAMSERPAIERALQEATEATDRAWDQWALENRRALRAERERDALRAQLNSVRSYAEERAAYGRSNRTVGSARIASDLFAILDAEQTIAELAERQAAPNGLEGVL